MSLSLRRFLLCGLGFCLFAGGLPVAAHARNDSPGTRSPKSASPRASPAKLSTAKRAPPAELPAIAFYVARGAPNSCGRGCDQWIAADGTIDESAASRLRQVLRKLNGRKLPVFFNSPGGHAAGGMELGRLLRREKLVASVGRTVPEGCDRAKLYEDACRALKQDGVTAELNDTVTMCHSACVYVLAGAYERVVPPGARLGIHSGAIRPRTPVSATVMAMAKKLGDLRIDAYLREMGVDRALLTEANAIPFQSVRFLRRDEIIRLGMDRREFGETNWHFMDKPRPTVSKAWFMRSGNPAFPYRTAFLRMDCGATSMPLTVGIEMAAEETGVGPRPFAVTLNGSRVDGVWTPEFIAREPTRFAMRTTGIASEKVASVDDGGAIEIAVPNPAVGAQPAVKLTMSGFSGAYAMLRKACDAAWSATAGRQPSTTTLGPRWTGEPQRNIDRQH